MVVIRKIQKRIKFLEAFYENNGYEKTKYRLCID